jgi:hypothetical protein
MIGAIIAWDKSENKKHGQNASPSSVPAKRWTAIVFLLCMGFVFCLRNLGIQGSPETQFAMLYRMQHLDCGVSPMLPPLLLNLGIYLFTWQAMAGNLLMDNGRPLLKPSPAKEAQEATAAKDAPEVSKGSVSFLWGRIWTAVKRALGLEPHQEPTDGPNSVKHHECSRLTDHLGFQITSVASVTFICRPKIFLPAIGVGFAIWILVVSELQYATVEWSEYSINVVDGHITRNLHPFRVCHLRLLANEIASLAES